MHSHSEDDNSDNSHISAGLVSADPFRRAKATLRLGRHADPAALDQLLALLADPDWPVVKAALKVLRHYRDPRIVTAAQAILREDYYSWVYSRGIAIAGVATRALRSQGEEGFQALLTLLREAKDEEVRGQTIIWQLAVLRDPRAIEPLIACFDSTVYEVANAASRAMRHFGVAAIPPLIAAMSTTDMSVFQHVSTAFRQIGLPAVSALLNALRYEEDDNIRAGAADVLGNFDSKEVREALWVALDDPDEDVSRMAMLSLWDFGDLRVFDLLLAEDPNPTPTRNYPYDNLARPGSAAVPLLIAALEDQARPTYQRVNAARALGLIEDERTEEPLLTALRDDDEDMRAAAIIALDDLRDTREVEPLLAALHDPSSEVRRRAIGKLASMDDDRAFDAVARYVRESGDDEEGYKSASGALRALAMHHGERALPLLREMALGSDRWKFLSAIGPLGLLGAPAVPVLLEIARDPRPERRLHVITWLKSAYRHSPDPRIVEFLFKTIQENPLSEITEQTRYQMALRFEATRALAECGDPRAVGPLLEILQSPTSSPSMRQSTVQPLGELGDVRVLEALTAAYDASMAGNDGIDVSKHPTQQYSFQDALLWAMSKIHSRLDEAEVGEDSSDTSAAT
ncbi:MAG TPA: HEAT repeat domain-containing protein [Ktedonobacterales bacterium]|nr:HEAT repeat domain-containing protein [Ktedonobacterales bacterium]